MPDRGPLEPDDQAGNRVKRLRLAAGRTQAELTGPGMSAGYLSMIESGARPPSRTALRLLAERLGTTPEFLATGTDTTDTESERRLAFAEIALRNGSAAEALTEFESVLAACPPRLRSRALLGRAGANEALNRLTPAIADYTELWREAEPGSIAWAERSLDVARARAADGDRVAAVEFAEAALAAFEDLGLPWHESAIRLGVTLAGLLKTEDVHRATRLIERLVGLADELGSPLARGSAYWNAAVIAHDRGRAGDALDLAERALALLGETDHAVNLAALRAVYGRLLALAHTDRADEGLASVRASMEELRALGAASAVRDSVECSYAEIALRAGHIDDALTHARAVVRRVAGDGSLTEALARLTLAEATHVAGAPGAAAELKRATTMLSHTPDSPGDVADAWQRVAALHERLGDATAALAAYRRAMAATGHRVPPELPPGRTPAKTPGGAAHVPFAEPSVPPTPGRTGRE